MNSSFGKSVNFAGTGATVYPDNIASLNVSSNEALGYQVFQVNAGRASAYAPQPAPPGQWYYVAGTFDGSTVKIYVNGVLSASTATNNIMAVSGPDPAWLAYDPYTTYYVSAALAEVHLASIARSADWIQTEYNNQSTPWLFLAIARQETRK